MAPKRRSTRKSSAAVVREASLAASELSALSDTPDETSDSKDSCPACSSKPGRVGLEDKETWIQCDKCKTWFHWHCVGDGGDYEALQKWCAKYAVLELDEQFLSIGTVDLVAKQIHLSNLR